MNYSKIREKKLILKGQSGLAIQPAIPGSFIGQEMTGYTWTGAAWVPKSSYDAVHGGQQKPIGQTPQNTEYEDTSVIADGTAAAEQAKAEQAQAEQEAKKRQALDATNMAFGVLGFNAVQTQEQKTDEDGNKVGLSEQGQMALGITSQAVSKTVNAVDEATMGDKNFSASSKAIDSTVHGVSGALMKSGNPYAMAAGAALEVINFATKAGGKNVPGYDVNINNSGYGNLGHQESEAGRVWDNWTGATARKLKKRNEQARMALAAMDVSNDIAYEQEARANSVTNVLQANQIALAGGIDTSLLGN